MATLTFKTDKASYNSGDKITVTLVLTGVPADTPATTKAVPVTAFATVDASQIPANGTITVNVPAVLHTVSYDSVTLGGVALTKTADPTVWTGTV